jgi:DNA-directed RNA polymerase specialized sigma54-like protein
VKPSPLALRQSQGLRQELQLLPQLLQSLELLTLPAMELTEWLERQAEGNEALEVRRAQPATDHDWWQDEPARATTLAEHIEAELALCELEPAVLRTIRWLALRLDARGWLCEPEEELHAEAVREGLLREDESLVLRKALHQLQQLEPRGLGARDLAEALLLQLDPRAADYALLTRLIEFHLADLAARRLHVVARRPRRPSIRKCSSSARLTAASRFAWIHAAGLPQGSILQRNNWHARMVRAANWGATCGPSWRPRARSPMRWSSASAPWRASRPASSRDSRAS